MVGDELTVEARAFSGDAAAQPYKERLKVSSWRFKDVLFESHTGRPIELRKHFHDTFQIAVNTRAPGRYICDGRNWSAIPGDVVAIHPGEVHSTVGECERPGNKPALLMYVTQERLMATASEIAGIAQSSVSFDQRVFTDPDVASKLTRTHVESAGLESELYKDSWLLETLSALVMRHALKRARMHSPPHQDRKKMELARDYLSDNFAESVSLDTLASVVQLSPFQLCRTFSREYGMSPHNYQTAMRVDRAKVLLAGGVSPADAAAATGFYDQSHLHRHFQRIVGVTPGRYAAAR